LIVTRKRRAAPRPRATGAGTEPGPGQRRLRVGEELRHALSKILCGGECRDPALDHASITVTEVRVSQDLRSATAFVMPLAGANAPEILAGLKRSAAFLRRIVAREVALRNTPHLVFELDQSFDYADRISALLAQPEVARDLQPRSLPAADRRDES
jgi:ribosome-binding factor A